MSNSSLEERQRVILGKATEVAVPIVNEGLHDRGFETAVCVATRLSLPVRLLHVVAGDGPDPSEEAATPLEVTRDRFAARYPRLELASESIVSDDVAAGLCDLFSDESLVVMATEQAGSATTPDSVAEAVVRIWEGPVLLVGPDATVPDLGDPIVVPLDGSPLAERAIAIALELSEVFDAPLWLVEVVDPATTRAVMELRAAGEQASESAYIRGVANDVSTGTRHAGWEIVHNEDPLTGILEFAQDQQAGLIVASTHGASGIERLAFGSVCMGLVRDAPVPVITVHPRPERRRALGN